MRTLLFALPLVVLVPSAAAAQPAGAACDFRAATLEALLAAADDAGRASAALEGGDGGGASEALLGAAADLLAERKRVKQDGRTQLDATERKDLLKALGGARKRARKGASQAAKRSPERATTGVARAAVAIGAALQEQTVAYEEHGCAGNSLGVSQLFVARNETRNVPGGTVIVAANGATVLGGLVALGEGGLSLIVESGDLVLEGSVDARGDAPVARGAGLEESCGDARNLLLEATHGGVRIGASFLAYARSGASCQELTVSNASQLFVGTPAGSFHGARGGNGGDIRVTAGDRTILFAQRTTAVGPFSPGNGGAGESLRMSQSFLPPSGYSEVAFFGGDGGRSGRLVLTPNVSLAVPDILYGSTGSGGDAGSVHWELPEHVEPFPNELGLVLAHGGAGGNGAWRGGSGGNAVYLGGSVVRSDWQKPPFAEADGGLGGSLFRDAPYGLRDTVYGGGGGSSEIVGHRGRDGDPEHPAGADGGDAQAFGGSANLSEGPGVAASFGGPGGAASATSGGGGDGVSSCGPPRIGGGSGGAPGRAYVYGGDGGNALGGRGGDGGPTLRAESGAPGQGGSGEPPGLCGPPATAPNSNAGHGGTGEDSGIDGHAALPSALPCAGAPRSCDETPIEVACMRPRQATASTVDRFEGSTEVRRSETMIESCDPSGCETQHVGEETTVSLTDPPSFDPMHFAYDTTNDSFPSTDLDLFTWTFLAHCTREGVLHHAGAEGADRINDFRTIRHSCSGSCDCPPAHPPTGCCPSPPGSPNPYRPC
ncbi:MAG TPA: hypothetical protein VNE71_08140 [Myxococcota bacterium]|nr:hypothetical protein [Myxococcota bacterium]